jgi:DNA-directed RNA polymerase subunit RPC12/RpoP
VNVQGSAVDVVMLGLDGFRVLEAARVDGELELVVETTAARDWCRRCGVRALSKGRPTVVVRDVDGLGRAVRLRWIKRRWRCPKPGCPAGSWTEQTAAIGARMAMTERARARACRRVGRDGHSVAAVARGFGSAGTRSCVPWSITARRWSMIQIGPRGCARWVSMRPRFCGPRRGIAMVADLHHVSLATMVPGLFSQSAAESLRPELAAALDGYCACWMAILSSAVFGPISPSSIGYRHVASRAKRRIRKVTSV